MSLVCSQVAYAVTGFAGGLLRFWAMATLDRHFTFEVGIVKDHKWVLYIWLPGREQQLWWPRKMLWEEVAFTTFCSLRQLSADHCMQEIRRGLLFQARSDRSLCTYPASWIHRRHSGISWHLFIPGTAAFNFDMVAGAGSPLDNLHGRMQPLSSRRLSWCVEPSFEASHTMVREELRKRAPFCSSA